MDVEKAEALARYRQRLYNEVPWSKSLLDTLERDDFTITHIRNQAAPVWFVRASPPDRVQSGFGLAPEVLIVLVRGELQATTVRAASEEVIRSGLRLDGNLLVVCDEKESLADRLERIGGHGQRVAWVQSSDQQWPSLEEVLRRELPLFDAYEERDPVRGAQLIGRDAEVAELRTRLVRGDAVGLFGLRKMGKTSVMRAVMDWFDPASGSRNGIGEPVESPHVAVVFDAGVLIERSVDELAGELLAVLNRRMKSAQEPALPRRGSGLVAWKSAVEALLDTGRRLCIVIDEFDLLFEGEGGEPPIPKLNQMFRLIRGWSQMFQGQVSLLLVGRDSTYLSVPELDGVTNSLLMWCTPMWLGPLQRDKANELLRKIGKRVGLSVGHESTHAALAWTGGHPLLHRQFGSALRQTVRAHTRAWKAETDPWIADTLVPFKAREAVHEVLREVVALLSKRHIDSYALLCDLAEGHAWEQAVATRGGVDGEAARTLINFGLVALDGSISEILAWYLTKLAANTPVRRVG